MIRRPTVLVLGAGSNAYLDFPTGDGLVKEIIALLQSVEAEELSLTLNVALADLNIFKTRLQDSGQPSIDQWLIANPDMAAIGRGLIAYVIGTKEDPALFKRDGWYKILFQYMTAEARLEDLPRNYVPEFNLEVQHLTVEAFAMMRRNAKTIQAPEGRRKRSFVVV